jgi:hypothetical protein
MRQSVALKVSCALLASATLYHCANSHPGSVVYSADNNFDETVALTSAQLTLPFLRRAGITIELLRNQANPTMTHLADGIIFNVDGQEADVERSGVFIISRHEVLVKMMTMGYNQLYGFYSGEYNQSYGTAHSYLLDPEYNSRLYHYILFRLPSSHPVENLFSENAAGAAVDPKVSWFAPPTAARAQTDASAEGQWAIAFTNTKSRFQMNAPPGTETPMQRAMRQGRAHALAGNIFQSNP